MTKKLIKVTNDKAAKLSQDALKVFVLTPHIREYLEEHDPMALRQAKAALDFTEVN